MFYLAGPMSGIPRFNFPAFDEAAAALRDRGYDIMSPAEMDDPQVRMLAMASPDGAGQGELAGQTWGDFLARDVKIIADECTGLVLLPGWSGSRGARLEAFVALLCGHPIYRYDSGTLVPMHNWVVAMMAVDEWTL